MPMKSLNFILKFLATESTFLHHKHLEREQLMIQPY